MLEKIIESTAYLGAGVGALVAVALLLRKMNVTIGGENSVIKSMKDELERLAATNVTLSNATSDLQKEVLKLRTQNIELHGEIAALREENSRLTLEILRLNEQIDKWDNKCANCKFKPVDEDNQ